MRIIIYTVRNIISVFGILLLFATCASEKNEHPGHTVITKWQGDKRSAISITYDDGVITNFTVARPIMNDLGLPGTFYIVTGKVEGSQKGKFIGRPKDEIIKETATIKTNPDNFFERASLIAYTGMKDAVEYNVEAGSLFEEGKIAEAHALIDEAYEQVRSSNLTDVENVVFDNHPEDTTTWKEYQLYTSEGHEIASHSITHPRLSVLDEVNMLYELEQSQSDIQKFLGAKYTFSAECPFGTENPRVMEYALKVYPALRNRMPEPYLDELNRSSQRLPGESDKEYVQWQRGPHTDTSMDLMKSWVDTSIVHDNIWLVLVFHGVDGIGWEPRTGADLQEYFGYIKQKEDYVWVATFADVTKYVRERKNSKVSSTLKDQAIVVNVSSDLDPEVYDVPITLKTYLPEAWKASVLTKSSNPDDKVTLSIQQDALGAYVLYSVIPGQSEIILTERVDL
ncbi:MAG: hypothetical protein DHS20C17_25000 [Cyclobacteriaceae bacterium]|nr:MAG: hypothetical protein DHS20C17_25000 [Cyclobacteriaceae bacterium]